MNNAVESSCGKTGGNGYTVFHFAVQIKKRRYVRVQNGIKQCVDEVYLEEVNRSPFSKNLRFRDNREREGLEVAHV